MKSILTFDQMKPILKNRFNTYVYSHINFVGEKLQNVNNFKNIYQEKMSSP